MNYRKFWLVNSLGNKYELTDKNIKTFLNTPQGLGFDRKITVQQIGNSEIITSQQFKLTDVTAELLFYAQQNGTIYQDYQDFIQFIKYKPLELHYQTPNEQESYYSEISITSLQKAEISSDGILHCNATFHRLTEWLGKDVVVELYNTPTGDGKQYPLERPYQYAGTDLSNKPIYNNGTDEIGFILRVEGEIQNMMFTLSQGSDVYGVCKINGTYDFVEINSTEKDETIYLERNGSAITNPRQYQDFSVANGGYLTWCKLRVGESTFSFTAGNIDTFDGKISLIYKNSYVSV